METYHEGITHNERTQSRDDDTVWVRVEEDAVPTWMDPPGFFLKAYTILGGSQACAEVVNYYRRKGISLIVKTVGRELRAGDRICLDPVCPPSNLFEIKDLRR